MAEFRVEEEALALIRELRGLVTRLKSRDRGLADQLSRAASSVALNIGESRLSDPGNARARLFSAAGSAGEVRIGLRVAEAWGFCSAEETAVALGLLEDIIRTLWKLTR